MDSAKPTTALFDVFLRLRPSAADKERFLDVEETLEAAPTHITIKPPANDTRRRAVERFAFTRVFEENAGQRDIFETSGAVQLIEGVLGQRGRAGQDGLLATLGVTGSGKSHTILGSKTQRGLTQLSLDVLFQHTEPYLANADAGDFVFESLCAADVSEAQILPAFQFLDAIYGNGDTTRMSRATTPAMVRDSTLQFSANTPGTFPIIYEEEAEQPQRPTGTVYERLYPVLPSLRPSYLPHSPSKHTLARVTRSIARLTHSFQDSSFLSSHAASSRRIVPRVSTLPQAPCVEDIAVDIDSTAEYAIVISMYEVHNDRIYDLLCASATGKSQLRRRALLFKSTEASPDRKVVAGLRKVVCSSLEEALLVLETGLQERRVAGTGSNAVSSRSHGFFCVEVKKRSRGRSVPGPWSSSTMTIVDLAGSERARTAKTAGATLAEAGKINESLMYLGQCMQIQSDNAQTLNPRAVPFRQCKLTELLFSNSFTHSPAHRAPQKSIMIVTADPLGDFNATSQILRYSALAREVTVPRIPSVTSTILSGASAKLASRPTTPGSSVQELEAALAEIARLRDHLEATQVQLEEETNRRIEAEAFWNAAESRNEEIEAEIREEVWSEMEAKLVQEQRRWRAARDEELDRQDEFMDHKLELMANAIEVYEDPEDDDKENTAPIDDVRELTTGLGKMSVKDSRIGELEDENAKLREKLASMEREKEVMRSPSKKVRVLKTRKWDGSGMGLDDPF